MIQLPGRRWSCGFTTNTPTYHVVLVVAQKGANAAVIGRPHALGQWCEPSHVVVDLVDLVVLLDGVGDYGHWHPGHPVLVSPVPVLLLVVIVVVVVMVVVPVVRVRAVRTRRPSQETSTSAAPSLPARFTLAQSSVQHVCPGNQKFVHSDSNKSNYSNGTTNNKFNFKCT